MNYPINKDTTQTHTHCNYIPIEPLRHDRSNLLFLACGLSNGERDNTAVTADSGLVLIASDQRRAQLAREAFCSEKAFSTGAFVQRDACWVDW